MEELEVEIAGRTLRLETGRLATQADGAVVVRQGGSFLLASVVAATTPSHRGFLPLTVEYRERLAAGGRIPGGFLRREGRITDREVLTSRLVDRTLRPLFAEGYARETQVQITVFGADEATDLDSLALIAAAAAVHVSDLPFHGPAAGLRLAGPLDAPVALPPRGVAARAEVDLVVAASRSGLVMVEGQARELEEAALVRLIGAAASEISGLLDALDGLRDATGRPPREPPALARPALDARVWALAGARLDAALDEPDKRARHVALETARAQVTAALTADGQTTGATSVTSMTDFAMEVAFEATLRRAFRERTLAGRRVGGRGLDEVRPVTCEVGLLGSNHGSALFTRGGTQALCSATIGATRDAQSVETVLGRESEPFMLHYNFPPYSVGEVRPLRGPGRREIGHGNLARRALEPVLPPTGSFPHAVRVVSDITESDGSSSMATVCGGCMALLDAGVPLRAPVAGVAMGLVVEGDHAAILTDIVADEDHLGDMDFKVAGTAAGITAVQLDNKVGGLELALLGRALDQARRGRLHILGRMAGALAEPPDDDVSSHVTRVRIPRDRVAPLLGPGERAMRDLQAATGTSIDVRDDGQVVIQGPDEAGVDRAARRIEAAGRGLSQGNVYVAEVVSIKDYGCFVRVGLDEGLVHISELARGRVDQVSDVVHVGEQVLVRVQGVDARGRLQLSRRAAMGVPREEAIEA